MSKTKGNVIDPLIVMDELGTDALRFTLLVGSTPGKDMNLSLKKVEANRNFANKLWNVSRFVIAEISKLGTGTLEKNQSTHHLPISHQLTSPTLADAWILARLNELT